MGHLLGHARVSTADQQPHLQVDALERAGCYGGSPRPPAARRPPALDQVLDQLRAGDTVVVWKLDRPGRSGKAELVTLPNIC
jgi:DNA invertase Pin-like site-specific DNA recombinase